MKPRKTEDIADCLLRKGFQRANRDHVFFFLFVNGKKTNIRTKISHGSTECGANLLSIMANQLQLKSQELEALLDCPLSEEQYIDLLRQRGKLPPE